jgi:aspartyl protease family protein
MSRILMLVLGALGATLILLLVNDSKGTTLGLANDDFARMASLGVLGVMLAAGITRRGMRFGDTVRQAMIWLVVLLALVAGYEYRFELQDVANRLTAGLVPSRPQTAIGTDGRANVTVEKSNNGHFEIAGTVNGASARFLVDTGASSVMLTTLDAASAGFRQEDLTFSSPISTANGSAMAAEVRLNEIAIGGITRRDIRALVAEEGKLDTSLLGMSFLSSLSGYTVRQDQLVLQD